MPAEGCLYFFIFFILVMILAIQDTAMISFLVEAMQRKVNKNDKPKYSNNHLSCCDKLVTRTLRIHVYLWTKLYFCKARGRARIDCNMFRSDFVFHCPPPQNIDLCGS